MALYDNLNKTSTLTIAPSFQDFYDRTLIENLETDVVHARDGQKRRLPLNSGDRIQFRKMTPFALATTPLTEGVTPDGQTLEQTEIFVTPVQYGKHTEITDKAHLVALDNWNQETAKLHHMQAVESLDVVARDALHLGTQVIYAGSKTMRAELEATHVLSSTEIRKAVRLLEKNRAKRFPDGYYHAIIGPDTKYDLQSDAAWLDPGKYQDKSSIQTGEIGVLYGVKFFESLYAKQNEQPAYLFGTTASVTVATGTPLNTSTKVLTLNVDETGVDATVAASLVGETVVIDYAGTPFTTTITAATAYAAPSTAATITLAALPSGASTATFSAKEVAPFGGGKAGIDTAATLIYGMDAFGAVSLGDMGDNVKTIINPPGSAGSDDPLAQRGTIAWKVEGYAVAIIQDALIVRVEHGFTA